MDTPHARSILWIVPKWPFPAHDGARRATQALLRELTRRRAVIDLAAVAGSDESPDPGLARRELGVREVHIVRRAAVANRGVRAVLAMARSLLLDPLLPVTMRYFAERRVRGELRELTARGEWDAVVYDGLHPAAHAARRGRFHLRAGSPKVIYRAHNREADIWRSRAAAARSPVARALFSFEERKVRRFEDSLVAACSALAPVSEEDLAAFAGVPGERLERVVPIGVPFGPPLDPPERFGRLIFFGKLDWHPNREGLAWFLREVWPQVAAERSDLELVIAGSGGREFLGEFGALPRVADLGTVGDPADVYRDASIALVPIFVGSGTRVKAIEAASFGRACLGTPLGLAGLDLEEGRSCRIGTDAAAWIAALRRLSPVECAELGAGAYASLRDTYECGRAAAAFEALLGAPARRMPARASIAAPVRRAGKRLLTARPFDKLARDGSAAVLLYHRVVGSERDLPARSPYRGLAVTADRFEEQVAALARRFTPLSLEELAARREQGTLPKRAVALTFDDGYRDNLEVALPILERYGVPATIFVTTGFVGGNAEPCWNTAEELRRGLFLTWDEVRSIDRGGLVSIGAHTVSHPRLSRLSPEELRFELTESKRILEAQLGRAVDAFAYPFGDASAAGEREFAAAREAGYRIAVTAQFGRIGGDKAENRYALPRVHVDIDDSLPDVLWKIAPLSLRAQRSNPRRAKCRGLSTTGIASLRSQ